MVGSCAYKSPNIPSLSNKNENNLQDYPFCSQYMQLHGNMANQLVAACCKCISISLSPQLASSNQKELEIDLFLQV